MFLAAVVCVPVPAAEPPGYYATAAGLTGTALRGALHQIIRSHTSVGYGQSDEAMLITDRAPSDPSRVILIYSRRAERDVHFIGNGNPTPNPPTAGWNREHTWPDSLGIDGNEPAYSDLFNLRPSDVDVNSDRGNLYFDESTPGGGHQNPAHGEAVLCTQDGDSWEPPSEVKGDLARSMFYMDIRYEGGSSGEPNLQLTDNTALISTSAAYMGRLSTLLVWHFIDPVSDAERARNEAVFTFQGNRNPFIDHPEWVESIFGDVLRLKIVQLPGTVELRWPAQVQDVLGGVESSTNLTSWTTQSGTPAVQGAEKVLQVLLGGDQRFFHLRLRERDG